MSRNLPLILTLALAACVPKQKYEASLAANTELQEDIDGLKLELGDMSDELVRLQVELDAAQTVIDESSHQLAEKIALTGELASDVERMREALSDVELRKARAETVLSGYRTVIAELRELVEKKVLTVEFVDGEFVLRLETDTLFAPGRADLTPEGRTAMTQVAKVLAGLDRDLLVVGHTDSDPITSSAQYPSNWYLGAARAISVVELLTGAGVKSERIGAVSYSQYKPVDSNATRQGKAHNRRIEIVLVPDLTTLPEYEDLRKLVEDKEQ